MTIATLDAWLLHKRPSGDTSLQLTFFTYEQGLLSCWYKGARVRKKQTSLQAFTPFWLAVVSRGEWHYVRQLEATAAIATLHAKALFAGLYINELIYHLLRPLDPYPTLFTAYRHSIQNLARHNEPLAIEMILRQFEWNLLSYCGYSPSFTHEARSSKVIDPDCYYRFIADEGFVFSPKGMSGSEILKIGTGKIDDPNVLKTAKYIMRLAIDQLLGGRPLKSRSLYTAHP